MVLGERGESGAAGGEATWHPLSAKDARGDSGHLGASGIPSFIATNHTPILSLGQLSRSWLIIPSSSMPGGPQSHSEMEGIAYLGRDGDIKGV